MASKMMKRFTGSLGRSRSVASQGGSGPATDLDNAPADSPEANVGRTIRLFCESGSTSNGGEEVLHLPVIVEAAESSPTAAAAAALQIRKFLSREWASKPHVQYNAIMLVRILSDNPGPSFTKNFDKAFVTTVKEALRNCKDASTQQILRETLDSLEANKQYQEGMEGLVQMWRKEKGQQASFTQGGNRSIAARNQNSHLYGQPTQQNGQHAGPQRSHSRHNTLPAPQELASRIEEARNTAKILLQLIQSTPQDEVLQNDLLREFADRCQSAQRSMQGYVNCDNPAPDDDTMLTLIETNEQLSLASSRYQRSLLNARKAMGVAPSPNSEVRNNLNTSGPYSAPMQQPQPVQSDNLFAAAAQTQQPPTPRSDLYSGNDGYQPPQSYHQQQSYPSPQSYQTPQQGYPSPPQSYQSPPGPPPHHTNRTSISSAHDSYHAIPDPSIQMLARLNSRDGESPSHFDSANQAPRQPSLDRPSDPFADPLEHDSNSAPLAIDSTQNPARKPHSHAFSIDAEPAYAPQYDRRDTTQLENAYSTNANSDNRNSYSTRPISPPSSPPRPGMNSAYHNSGVTQSYVGRQASAANGLTMHGGQPNAVQEIDGHSEVGRRDVRDSNGSSGYNVSPVDVRGSRG